MKKKYPINDEFRAFTNFTPPVNRLMIAFAQVFTQLPPPYLFLDKELSVKKHKIKADDGGSVRIYEIGKKDISENAPCLIYYHGGGFIFEGTDYHYKLCMEYAKRVGCKVIYVKYRLCPKYPFPIPQKDCYLAYRYIYENADIFNVDKNRIAVGGDSAGGQLSAVVSLMAKRDGIKTPHFQLLLYPFLDMRNDSESAKRFTDTPMWNSSLSVKIYPIINPNGISHAEHFLSPCEVENLDGLPPAYIETAEFDCLHDDGILYYKRLCEAGVEATLNETKGTMHGFDIILNAPTTKKVVRERIEYMKTAFGIK